MSAPHPRASAAVSPAVRRGPRRNAIRAVALVLAGAALVHASTPAVAPATATALAREAFVYGYPLVDGYGVLHSYALDPGSPEYKGPLNHLAHSRTVATPADKAVVAPNVDTPYSHVWLDLRTEPVVVTIPAFEAGRYVSLQLIDLHTYIVGYVTPRTNGTAGGDFLVAGPGWSGPVPPGIKAVFRSPTSLALGLFRTQLFDAADLPAVHRVQDGMKVTPLSAYLGQSPPPAAPALVPVAPIDVRREPTSPQYFAIVNWMLQFMPPIPEDAALRERVAAIGIGPGLPFAPADPALQAAITAGMRAGLGDLGERARRVRSSAELFGSREFLKDDHLVRAVGAMLGIYGNAAEEFLGVGYPADGAGRPFDGSFRYRIRFAPDGLPPVGAFWSITVYDAARTLYANPQNRQVINSPMLPGLVRDADGGITLYIQHESPGAGLEPNWLPVPRGTFVLTFRTYLPGEAIRTGRWLAPPVQRLD
jgi:hypothetical protein